MMNEIVKKMIEIMKNTGLICPCGVKADLIKESEERLDFVCPACGENLSFYYEEEEKVD